MSKTTKSLRTGETNTRNSMFKSKRYFNKELFDFSADEFDLYLINIIHEWLKTLSLLAIFLVPVFFLLDSFMMPKELLQKFGIYRFAATIIVIIQFVIIRRNKPGNISYIHGYFMSTLIGGMIVLMTVDLGGFASSYYAGLNLVIIGLNLLLPWRAIHSAINCMIIISMYLIFNVIAGNDFESQILANNLFFLFSTAIIAVSINHVKHKLVRQEFDLLIELKKARDALWSEMELAKRIQTALLPADYQIKGFEIAAAMFPAKEVGGDYYDIIETPTGEKWIAIGDVSGHGVDSGLIMMMAQTSTLSMINSSNNCRPTEILKSVNTVIRENISRLSSNHYMSMMAIHLNETQMTVAGKHQDIIIYRSALNKTEVIPTQGTWLGISDSIDLSISDITVKIKEGDIVLLFTDGITEACNVNGEMFGQDRLEQALNEFADLPANNLLNKIMAKVQEYQDEQLDDMTLVIIKKRTV